MNTYTDYQSLKCNVYNIYLTYEKVFTNAIQQIMEIYPHLYDASEVNKYMLSSAKQTACK